MAPRGAGLVVLLAGLFSMHAGAAFATTAQWDLNGNFNSSTGGTALSADAVAGSGAPAFSFESAVISGQNAIVAHFQRHTFFKVVPGVGPNGGGAYVNQYTLIMDVMFPDRSPSSGWASLYQTNEVNENDGDWFVNPANGIGIDGNYGGSVPDGTWHRLALVLDTTAGTFTSFVDGVQVQQNPGQTIDNRFSLYSTADGPIEGFSIFADESGDDAEGYVNSVQFRDVPLTPAQILALGGPNAHGIPLPVAATPAANVYALAALALMLLAAGVALQSRRLAAAA